MNPRLLRMRNFGNHTDSTIDFTTLGKSAALVGPTGSGKSTVLDGIIFALTGEVRHSLDEQVRRGEQELTDEFHFDSGGSTYKVIRKRSKKGRGSTTADLYQLARDRAWSHVLPVEAWVPLKPVKEKLEAILHADYELLTSTSFCLQGESAKLMKQRPADRLKMVRRLLRAERYADYQTAGRAELRILEAHRETAVADLQRAEEDVRVAQEAADQIPAAEEEQADLEAQERSIASTLTDLDLRLAEAARAAERRLELERAVTHAEAEHTEAREAVARVEKRLAVRREVANGRGAAATGVAHLERARRDLAIAQTALEEARSAFRLADQAERDFVSRRQVATDELNGAERAVDEELRAVRVERQIAFERADRDLHDVRDREMKRLLDAAKVKLAFQHHQEKLAAATAGAARVEEERATLAASDARLAGARAALEAGQTSEREWSDRRGLLVAEGQEIAARGKEAEQAIRAERRLAMERASAALGEAWSREREAAAALVHLKDEHAHAKNALEAATARAAMLPTFTCRGEGPYAACPAISDTVRERDRIPDLRSRFALLEEKLAAAGAIGAVDPSRAAAQRALDKARAAIDAPLPASAIGVELEAKREAVRQLGPAPKLDVARSAVTAAETEAAAARRALDGLAHWPGALRELEAARPEEPIDDVAAAAEFHASEAAALEVVASTRSALTALPPAPSTQRLEAARAVVAGLGPIATSEVERNALSAAERVETTARSGVDALSEWPAALRAAEVAVEEVVALTAEAATAAAAHGRAVERLGAARAAVATITIGEVEALRRRRDEVGAEQRQARNNAAALAARVLQLREASFLFDGARNVLATCQAALTTASEEVKMTTELVEVYQEVPMLLLQLAIPAIEQAANSMLEDLGEGYRMRCDDEKRSKSSDGARDTFDIWVTDPSGYEAPYETFSGGERFQLDIALREGFGEIIAARAGVHDQPMLVIDEGWGTLDAEHIKSFVKVMERVIASGRFSFVLCVSHIQELIDAFRVKVIASKGHTGSTLQVVNG